MLNVSILYLQILHSKLIRMLSQCQGLVILRHLVRPIAPNAVIKPDVFELTEIECLFLKN